MPRNYGLETRKMEATRACREGALEDNPEPSMASFVALVAIFTVSVWILVMLAAA